MAKRYLTYELDYSVAIQLGRLNMQTGLLEYTSSGAPSGLVVGESGVNVLTVASGPYLGLAQDDLRQDMFGVSSLQMKPDEKLYFFTDGCYEFDVQRGDSVRELGYRGFVRLIKDISEQGWKNKIFAKLSELNRSPNFEDDLTILRLKFAISQIDKKAD